MSKDMYQNGKIYKLECEGLVYYGSTCSTLTKRLCGHKKDYKSWVNGKCRSITSFKLFEIGEPIIVLVENVSCENKEQLYARERFHIENNICVNRNTPGLTRQETNQKYINSHKEQIQKYNDGRKEEKKVYDLEYNKNNKDLKDKQRDKWAANNPEKIKESGKKYSSKPWTCECCNITICIGAKTRHVKSKTHLTKIV
jgi:ribosomal protein L37AE/L43A